jgi:hypothetical protein
MYQEQKHPRERTRSAFQRMRTRRTLPFVLLALVSPAAQAQINRTEINGTVTDTTGAAVADVSVTVVQDGTQATRQAKTNASGLFVVSSLPTGRFTVLLHGNGFQDVRVADVELHSGDTRTLNQKLTPGEVTQAVSVEADKEGAQLQKSDATFGGTIQSVQIRELPLNGRNIATLELLAPGAIDTGTGQQNTIRFVGQGIDDTNYRLDGVDASGVLRQALKSGLRLQFSTEAVSEFKVDAGAYTADTGGSAGGQVNLVSKSGTNEFHGSVFDYLRNSYFDAQSPIKSSVHPQFHLNQFGGGLGGPIVHDRTFFFVDYEGFRQSLGGVPQIGVVPSPAFRAQILAAHPELASLVNAYPQGQAPSPKDTGAYTLATVVPSPDTEDSGTARVDHRFTASDSSYVRYNIDDGSSTSALGALGQATTIGSRVQNFVLEELHIFSPTLLNEAEFGFNRNTYVQTQNSSNTLNTIVSGFSELYENYLKQQVGQSFSINDTVTTTRGNHTIKGGVDIRFPQFDEANSLDSTASFQSEANFAANRLNTFQLTAPLPDKGLRKLQAAGYVQDEWKASQALTLNYGLRYNYFSPFHEQHNNEIPFDIATCGGYCAFGSEFYFPNYLDFDPRVGVAYSPESLHGRTVFRAGFGVYHGEDQLGDEDAPIVNDGPSTILTSGKQSNGTNMQYSYPTPPALTPLTGLALTPRSLAQHHPDAYSEQWTGSVQHAFSGDTVVTMTYIGLKGTHLFRRSYTNLIDPVTGTRPLPRYPSQIDTKYNEGKSIFHALQVNLDRRFHNGFFIAGNYMLSHAINDGSVGAGESDAAENVHNFPGEYGSSDDDVRNTGNVSLVYDLPVGRGRRFLSNNTAADVVVGGWSVNTLLEARAGIPLNILLSRSATALPDGNNVNQRPNRVPGQPLYLGGRGINAWLNPAAFAVPANGTWGNLAKNAATGPALWQDDSAVEKAFHVTERSNVIFRAEAFNLFNRAQYGQPGTGLNVGSNGAILPTATFGKITQTVNPTGLVGTGTPRELEFALRITY